MNTPAINVNVNALCLCRFPEWGRPHAQDCPGAPVLIPCPIPRSVTFWVVLGECSGCGLSQSRSRDGFVRHDTDCPARPIRASCSISGETWEESEVVACEYWTGPGRLVIEVSAAAPAWAASRDRWALVKALVLGHMRGGSITPPLGPAVLFEQRDAVYGALATMRRSEQAAHAAFLALPMDLRQASILTKQCGPVAADPVEGGIDLPSAKIFAIYVERLIEQVVVLGAT
jgi:hypothetical protein